MVVKIFNYSSRTSLGDTLKRADALREEIKKMEMVFQGQILGSITMSWESPPIRKKAPKWKTFCGS